MSVAQNYKALLQIRGEASDRVNPIPINDEAVFANRIYERLFSLEPVGMYETQEGILIDSQENLLYKDSFDERKASKLVLPAYLLGLDYPLSLGGIAKENDSEYRLVNIRNAFQNTWFREIFAAKAAGKETLDKIVARAKGQDARLGDILLVMAGVMPEQSRFFKRRLSQLF